MTVVFTWSRVGGYEVSSKGDRTFSALYATLDGGRTIEEIYQCDIKGYDPGGTNWRLGKGKPALDPLTDLWEGYLQLWRTWARRHPDEMRRLYHAASQPPYNRVLSDMFGWTPVTQARALATLLNEMYNLV